MFGALKSLGKAVVKTATLPVSVVADVATFGGLLTDEEKPYTTRTVEGIMRDIKDVAKD